MDTTTITIAITSSRSHGIYSTVTSTYGTQPAAATVGNAFTRIYGTFGRVHSIIPRELSPRYPEFTRRCKKKKKESISLRSCSRIVRQNFVTWDEIARAHFTRHLYGVTCFIIQGVPFEACRLNIFSCDGARNISYGIWMVLKDH